MRLTKTSLSVLLIITLLALAEILSYDWAGRIWPILAAGWLFLLLSERIILFRQKFDIDRTLDQKFYLGRPSTILYNIKNRNKYPVRLLTAEVTPDTLTAELKTHEWNLAARQQQQQVTMITPVSLGTAKFAKIKITVLGRLALAWWTRSTSIPQSINIEPDYIASPQPIQSVLKELTPALDLQDFQSVTLVLNSGQLNQLVTGGLRRIDQYINACSKLAYRMLSAHRMVNIIIYDNVPRLIMQGCRQARQLADFFAHVQNCTEGSHQADHRCILPYLDKIHQPGLLLWYTDIDDTEKTIELEKIIKLYKPRFKIMLYSLVASEMVLLDDVLQHHCRSSYHKLEILTLQQQWHSSRQILQRAGIKTIAR